MTTFIIFGFAGVFILIAATQRQPWYGLLALEIVFILHQMIVDLSRDLGNEGGIVKEIVFAAFLVAIIVRRGSSKARNSAVWLYSCLGLAMVCSWIATVLSPYPLRAFGALRFFSFYPLLMVVPVELAEGFLARQIDAVRGVRLLIVIGVGVALFGLLSYRFGGLVDPRWNLSPAAMQAMTSRAGIAGNSVVSTLGNRANMGGFAMLMLVALLALARSKYRGTVLMTLAMGVVLLAALILTFNRTAYVGLCVGAFAGLYTSKRVRLRFVAVILGLVVIMVPIVEAVAPESFTAAVFGVDATLSGRTNVWQNVWSGVAEAPFGAGLGVYGNALQQFNDNATFNGLGAVDNTFLLILAEQGWQGVCAWIVLLIVIGHRIHRNVVTLKSPAGRLLADIGWCWYWAFLAMSITIDWFHAVAIVGMLWFFFGLQFVLGYAEKNFWNERAPVGRQRAGAIGAVGAGGRVVSPAPAYWQRRLQPGAYVPQRGLGAQ